MGNTKSRMKNAKRNIFWALVNRIVTMALPFLTRTVVIYYLGSVYLGLNTLYSSILTILSLAELGFGSAMVVSMYDPIARNDIASVNALLKLYRRIYRIIGIIVLILGISVLPFLKRLITGEVPADVNIYVLYAIYLSNTVLSYFLFAYKESLLTADQRMDVSSNIGTIVSISTNVLQLLSLLLFKNYYYYVIVYPVMTLIKNICTSCCVDRMYPQYRCEGEIDNSKLEDIKKRVAGLFIYRICYVSRDSFDSVVLSAFLGLTVLANYNNYLYIVVTLTGFLAIIKNSISAGVGNSIAIESEDKNYSDFNKCQLLYMWISGWCTVCLFCLYQPFIKLWLGDSFLFDKKTMALFCVYFYCYKMGDICAVYRQSAGLWWEDRFRPIVESIVNLTLNILLVRYIGVAGVMLSTIFCLVFINSIWASKVLFQCYFKHQRQRDYITLIIYFGFVTFISCAATGIVCDLICVDGVICLVVRGMICTIIPNLIMYLFYHKLSMFDDSKQLLCRLINK